MAAVLPQHTCRVCGVKSQSFGHYDLCPNHFVEWLTHDAGAYARAMATPVEQWTVMVDAWLERREQRERSSDELLALVKSAAT